MLACMRPQILLAILNVIPPSHFISLLIIGYVCVMYICMYVCMYVRVYARMQACYTALALSILASHKGKHSR